MNELALFAGAGGGILGGKLLGWKTVCAVEINPYCRSVLLARQRDGILDRFPIWDDVRTFDGKPWRGHVDVISAGFPCQPFSCAGKQRGKDDSRNMWPETIRIIREVRPRFAFLENVPGLVSCGYIGTILGDLAESGYDARWRMLSAAEVGAPHRRKRLWILANADQSRQEWSCRSIPKNRNASRGPDVGNGCSWILANTKGERSGGWPEQVRRETGSKPSRLLRPEPDEGMANANSSGLEKRQGKPGDDEQKLTTTERSRCQWWDTDPAERSTEPRMGRVVDGVADHVVRLEALGNGQVPAVVEAAWKILSEGNK